MPTAAGNTIATLMGPTGSGKTELAMRIADAMAVDLISVDSAMIYRGMDIGTAKPSADLLQQYPHALTNILDPAETYSVAQFLGDARRVIEGAFERGRLPLLVGGTMLYFNALKYGLADMPAVPEAVRLDLAARAQRDGLAALHEELLRVDPIAAAGIHPNNPQRLLRALEIFVATGEPISAHWARQARGGVADALNCRLVELTIEPPRPVIHARIASRFAAMLDAGLLDEVRELRHRGDLSIGLPSMRCVGYRQVWQHLDGAIDYDAMVARAIAATRQLAKRQYTWLRRWTGKLQVLADEQLNLGAILQSIQGASIVPRTS